VVPVVAGSNPVRHPYELPRLGSTLMSREGLVSATKFLALALGGLYVVAAFGGLAVLPVDNVVPWLAFLLIGAALMLVGQLALPPSGWSALLVSLGAVLGGLQLYWTLVVPIAVAAVIACSIALARRGAPA
jgi:hypothetical protein